MKINLNSNAIVDKFILKLWIEYSTKLSTNYYFYKNNFIHTV